MKFISRSALRIINSREVHHLKLLLTGTKPKIDNKTEEIYSPEVFSQKVEKGWKFGKFNEAAELFQKLSRHAQGHFRVIFRPKV